MRLLFLERQWAPAWRIFPWGLLLLGLGACGPDERSPAAPVAEPNLSGCELWSTGFGCDDGDPCTENDRCVGTTCAGKPRVCDDQDPCTVGVCGSGGACEFSPTTGSCDDGDPCTTGDQCSEGSCQGEPNSCDDGEVCTQDSCVRPFGCVHTAHWPPCDDQNPCTLDDHCADGACTGTLAQDCDKPWCGDGVCQEFESCQECPGDCSPAGLGTCSSSCDPTSGTDCSDNHACVPTTDGALNPQAFLSPTGRCGVACAGDDECPGGVCVATDGLSSWGLCFDSCDPQGVGQCDEGTQCVPLPEGGQGPSGVCSLWDPCTPGEGCGPGEAGACLGLPDHPGAGLCSVGCWAAWDATCPQSLGSCVALENALLHEGVCVGGPVTCDLAGQSDCPGGQTCAPLVGLAIAGKALVCAPAGGESQEGAQCDPQGCAPGLLCYQGACRATCDPGLGQEACPSGPCEVPEAWLLALGQSAGICTALCGDGLCGPGEGCAQCPNDCGPCAQCGDGVCAQSEHCTSCAIDCGACPLCGDGLCQSSEDCAGCQADCGACVCGDGQCQGAEACGGCEADCPECVCGDGLCAEGESCASCEADCGACACGNGVCEDGETCHGCPSDCEPCWCGDGQCTGAEDCVGCSMDCGACLCGDGICQAPEGCATCAADCGTCEVNCGDGHCAHLESCGTCAADCGVCPEICGDGLCVPSENCATCQADCCPLCGDGLCHLGETCTSCPSDCSLLTFGSCDGPCDPTEGALACQENYACVPSKAGTAALLPAAAGHGVCVDSPCAQDDDCAQGSCLLLGGLDSPGTCGVVCDPSDAQACGAWEVCLPQSGQGPDDGVTGLCRPERACDPPGDQFCSLLGASACVSLPEVGGGACMEGCYLDDPNACAGEATCVVKTDARWHEGTCVGQESACDPVAQSGCGPSETCKALGGQALGGTSYLCVATTGEGQAGAGCEDDTDCAAGLPCVYAVCRAYCDPEAGCEDGTCLAIGTLLSLPEETLGLCDPD